MRILVIGNGGREHALIWKLRQSPRVSEVLCIPGNGGICDEATCLPGDPKNIEAILALAHQRQPDITVVGPELPLSLGLVDEFSQRGLRIFGPSTDPARIEGSKAFAKDLMVKYGIPTSTHWTCDTPEEAHAHIRAHYLGGGATHLVVKADGIAAGKGVVVTGSESEAHDAVDLMMVVHAFGAAGDRIVIEERLEGEEASIMAKAPVAPGLATWFCCGRPSGGNCPTPNTTGAGSVSTSS